ncbi:MAG: ATP-dependent DNA helicase RecG [Lachnospiraceae bacterium]|nr:ATP-dependent DNA helicase RecG [Lachnospiraceae bacterium]
MKLSELKGIGEKTEQIFAKVGVRTVEDLLTYYPRTYEIYGEPVLIREMEKNGEPETVRGMITKKPFVKKTRRFDTVTSELRDSEGDILHLVWFNMPFIASTIKAGEMYTVRGVIKDKMGLTMEHPEIFTGDAYAQKMGELQPVYPLTSGLTGKTVSKAVKQALGYRHLIQEFLPASIRSENMLAELNFAIEAIHFPKNMEAYAQARKRLAFEEFFLFITALLSMKSEISQKMPHIDIYPQEKTDEIIRHLPYELTKAQQKVWQEIRKDFLGTRPMNRLIQGDVGSGKTILAFLALAEVVANGYQGAFMVPTEVLAEQHFKAALELFEKEEIPVNVVLLTGSMTKKQKNVVCEQIASGEADIIIGTHALIQENVTYHNLALVITDEQHRFGVRQRELLNQKGEKPHIMVMSATPIPRTLAIILYGDLDLSVIDELPANRLPRKNCVVDENYRPKAWDFIRKQVEAGHQAYVICPMVEESEKLEVESVIEYTDKLADYMSCAVRVAYLHGRMKGKEKNECMREFAEGNIQVLVSTTVVEVGVNVPNATVMVVENAERFGLAGLHQLRGRVGRGNSQSYCIFISGTTKKDTRKRLEILNKSNDGFYIAEEDLKLRGPGDFFGVRQSGAFAFRIGDVFTDAGLLEKAAAAAKKYMQGKIFMSEEEKVRLDAKIAAYLEGSIQALNL